MTNENYLMEEFYDTFGIEPKYIRGENLMEYSYGKLEYSEITDHKLLQMICILNKNELWGLPNNYNFAMQQILQSCISFVKCGCDCAGVTEEEVQKFKQQIQQLFKVSQSKEVQQC